MYGEAIHEAEFWRNHLESAVLQLILVEGDEALELRHRARNLLVVAMHVCDPKDLRALAADIADLHEKIAHFLRKIAACA